MTVRKISFGQGVDDLPVQARTIEKIEIVKHARCAGKALLHRERKGKAGRMKERVRGPGAEA